MNYINPLNFYWKSKTFSLPIPSVHLLFSCTERKQNLEKTIYTVLGENCMCFSQQHYSIDERERTRTRPQEETSRGKNPSHESNCRQNIQSNALQGPGTECQGCSKYVGHAQEEFRMLTLWHRECKQKSDVRSTDSYDAIRTYNSCKIYLWQKKKPLCISLSSSRSDGVGAHYNLRMKCSQPTNFTEKFLPDKLAAFRLVQQLPTFYETPKFITVFAKVFRFYLFCSACIHSTSS